MSTQMFSSPAARIAKTKGEILAHAIPHDVLGITGNQHKIGKNQSDTVIYRRWLPYGGATTNSTTINQWSVSAAAHLVQEGVTPDADTITPQDITVQLNQYAAMFMYTDKVADLYEDDIPMAQKELLGERMGLVREKIRYGALKGATNKFYAGGTSRSTVDETISLPLLRRISKSLIGNRGKLITKILEPTPNYNTAPVEAAFLVFCHSDMENDIRELPGFKETSEYGSRKVVHEMELGSADRYRFIISAELDSIPDSGAAVGSTGLVSTSASNIDIYPVIVVAKDAWGDVALRGMESFKVNHIPHTQKDKSDPLGQRGYVTSSFWSAAFIENDGHMAVLECGATDI